MTAMKTDVAGIKEIGGTSLGEKREISMCEVTGGDRQLPVTSVPQSREVDRFYNLPFIEIDPLRIAKKRCQSDQLFFFCLVKLTSFLEL